MSHHVYTFWRNGDALYVGCTNDLRRRMREHRTYRTAPEATYVDWSTFPDKAEAIAAEKARILDLLPSLNVRHHPDGPLPLWDHSTNPPRPLRSAA